MRIRNLHSRSHVTEQTQFQGSNTARHFRRLYLVALSAIAVLAIGGQVLVQYSLSSQHGNGHFVNKAGYQRMLSQRIALKMTLYNPADPDAAAQMKAIAALRDRWVTTHRELADNMHRIAYGATARHTLSGLFRELEQPLMHLAGLVTKLSDPGRVLTPAERTALMADQEYFLPLMDAVVLGFEHSVQARIDFLQRIELSLLAITLIVLALEAMLIFRPAVHRLQASLDQLERRNRQATRRLESLRHLAGGIAHSFNNVLTSILGHASLERHDALLQRRNTEYIDAQIDGCRRATEIITQLVMYSGHGEYVCTPIALSPWLAEVTCSFIPANVAVRLHYETTGDAEAAIDRAAFRQALEGILVNAVEAMKGRTGVVTVRLSQMMLTEPRLMSGPYRTELPAGLYACIQVIDHGKGIAAEDIDRIFDPYYTSKEFGRGLGLAAVLGIAHGHGGGIMVESIRNAGSTVSLFVPLVGRDSGTPFAPQTQAGQHDSI
jgi:signal transduction histidine kinase